MDCISLSDILYIGCVTYNIYTICVVANYGGCLLMK